MARIVSKAQVRAAARTCVRALSPADRRRHDAAICATIGSLAAYRRSRQLLAYLALDDEPKLDALLASAVAAGKRVFAPIVHPDGDLHFVRWLPRDGFAARKYGRWAPSSEDEPTDEPGIVLVAGRGFDLRGGRVGRGRGCYDRALPRLSRFRPWIGIAYDCQVFEAVERQAHDIAVDLVVSPSGVVVDATSDIGKNAV